MRRDHHRFAEGRRVPGLAGEARDGLPNGRHRGVVMGDLRATDDSEVFPGEVEQVLEVRFEARVVHLWKLKAGKIVSFEQFVDSQPVNDSMK